MKWKWDSPYIEKKMEAGENGNKKEQETEFEFIRIQIVYYVVYMLPPHFAGSKRKASKARFWQRDSAMSMYLE